MLLYAYVALEIDVQRVVCTVRFVEFRLERAVSASMRGSEVDAAGK
jgi:hypothetical protein